MRAFASPMKVAVVVLAAVVGYVTLTGAQVWVAAGRDQARPADAIIVLGAAQYEGAPSPALRARLDHAVGLYRAGLAPLVVVTGGSQPGDSFTEARASADYLLTNGVPEDALLREVHGRTTWESLAAAARFLHRRGVSEVVLVSDPYHSFRVAQTANEVGLTGWVSPTDERLQVTSARLARETAAVSIGRILGYRRLVSLQQRLQRPAQ